MPINVTLFGIVTFVKTVKFCNALSAILVTVLGISRVMPIILTAKLDPVIDTLLSSLKIKKASTIALFKIGVEIPATLKLSLV